MTTRKGHQTPQEVPQDVQYQAPYEATLPPISTMPYGNDHMATLSNQYQLPPAGPQPHLQQPQQVQQPQYSQQPQQHQHQQIQQAGSSRGVGKEPKKDSLKPLIGTRNGYTYRLVVRQQPIRARMCGFGDKDRRPITPPPCIRLEITQNGKEVDYDTYDQQFDASKLVLQVDLWDMNGEHEVNHVRHAGGASNPGISNATLTTYPPPQTHSYGMPGTVPQHAHHQHPHPHSQQVYAQPGPSAAGYYAHPAAPTHPGYQAVAPVPQAYQHQNIPPAAAYGAPSPSYYQGQGYAAQAAPVPPPPTFASVQPPPPPSQNSRMETTKNLIGSGAVNASKLYDDKRVLGLWFVFQDLSVRTEGTFRLRMYLVDVGDVERKEGRKTTYWLAMTFSETFQVFSAKKFPGVIESTPLSKAFATQGIKIPIRKDAKTLPNQAEYDADD